MPDIEASNCCGGADPERDPAEVVIAATQDNRSILEEFPSEKWEIIEEGESKMRVRFSTREDRTLIYGALITNSKLLWKY